MYNKKENAIVSISIVSIAILLILLNPFNLIDTAKEIVYMFRWKISGEYSKVPEPYKLFVEKSARQLIIEETDQKFEQYRARIDWLKQDVSKLEKLIRKQNSEIRQLKNKIVEIQVFKHRKCLVTDCYRIRVNKHVNCEFHLNQYRLKK